MSTVTILNACNHKQSLSTIIFGIDINVLADWMIQKYFDNVSVSPPYLSFTLISMGLSKSYHCKVQCPCKLFHMNTVFRSSTTKEKKEFFGSHLTWSVARFARLEKVSPIHSVWKSLKPSYFTKLQVKLDYIFWTYAKKNYW